MNKVMLIIIALILSAIAWGGIIWALSHTIHIGGTPSLTPQLFIVLIIFLIILLAFPSILILSLYKCTHTETREWIWAVTITAYYLFPAIVAISEFGTFLQRDTSSRFTEMLDDKNISYKQISRIASKTGNPESYILYSMLKKNRIDLAEPYFNEHPKAAYYNLADMMVYYYEHHQMEIDWQYCDSASIQASRVVEFLLDNGWDINAIETRDNIRTALRSAISNHDLRSANLLIERGADVNAGGVTPIWSAVYNSDIKRIRMLLEHGARVNFPTCSNIYEETLLHAAVKIGSTDIIRLLLDYGAEIKPEEDLLSLVDKQTNPELWNLLIKHGAKQSYEKRINEH